MYTFYTAVGFVLQFCHSIFYAFGYARVSLLNTSFLLTNNHVLIQSSRWGMLYMHNSLVRAEFSRRSSGTINIIHQQGSMGHTGKISLRSFVKNELASLEQFFYFVYIMFIIQNWWLKRAKFFPIRRNISKQQPTQSPFFQFHCAKFTKTSFFHTQIGTVCTTPSYEASRVHK